VFFMSACIGERKKEDEVTAKVRKKTRGMERMGVWGGGGRVSWLF